MKFMTINAKARSVRRIEMPTLQGVEEMMGLKLVDHGQVRAPLMGRLGQMLAPGIAIVVQEDGLYRDASDGRYFGLMGELYHGNAVLYAFDHHGETVDFPQALTIEPAFFDDLVAIEAAISEAAINRPVTTMNGVVMWTWPEKSQRHKTVIAEMLKEHRGPVQISDVTIINLPDRSGGTKQ
jgi:hypothetical protein